MEVLSEVKALIINGGGTVGATVSDIGGLTPTRTAEELLKSGVELPDRVSIDIAEGDKHDSTDNNIGDRVAWAEEIADRGDAIDAATIALGTDTIAESCAILGLIFRRSLQKPLIALSSQYTSTEPGGDNKSQIENNFRMCEFMVDNGIVGVYGLSNSCIYRGARLRKISEWDPDYLRSPGYEPAARAAAPISYREDLVRKVDPAVAVEGVTLHKEFDRNVMTLSNITADTNPTLIRVLVDSGNASGLILEAKGAGNLPDRPFEIGVDPETGQQIYSSVIEEVRRATSKGVLVGVMSAFEAGTIDMTRYDLGIKAAEAGAISFESLTPAFSDAKFRQALAENPLPDSINELQAANSDRARGILEERRKKIALFMQTDLIGEMLPLTV